jgi:hypothetical protein
MAGSTGAPARIVQTIQKLGDRTALSSPLIYMKIMYIEEFVVAIQRVGYLAWKVRVTCPL